MGRLTRATFLTLAGLGLVLPARVDAQLFANEPWEGDVGPTGSNPPVPPTSGAPNFWLTPNGLDRGYDPNHTPDWLNGWIATYDDDEDIGTPRVQQLLSRAAVIATGSSALVTPNQDDYLDYDPPGAFRAASGQRILRVSGFNQVDMVYRRLGSIIDEPSIFFGYLFQVNGGELNELDAIYFWFDEDADPANNHENSPTVGYVCRTAAGNTDLCVRLAQSAGFTYPPNTVTEADINAIPSARNIFVVVQIAKSSGTSVGNYDTMRLWVNPVNGDEFSPDVTLTSTAPTLIDTIEWVGIRTEALDAAPFPRDTFLIDGPRMGRTWPDLVPPDVVLAADLTSLTATRDGASVRIDWATAAELDSAGFRVYRANADGSRGAEVTAGLVGAQGSESTGASYSVVDENPGTTNAYFLVEIELDGSEVVNGPVTVTGEAPASSSVGNWTLY